MLQRITRPLGTSLRGSAWFFIVMSAIMVAWAGGQQMTDPTAGTALFQGFNDGLTYEPIGLTYDGVGGPIQALAQLALLATAVAFTVLPARTPRALRRRRLGHLALVGWATLWAGNLAWMTAVAPGLDTVSQTAVLAVCLLGTVTRAIGGSRRLQPAVTTKVELVEHDLTPDRISTSDAVAEIPVPAPEAVDTPDVRKATLHGRIIARGRAVGCNACECIPRVKERAVHVADHVRQRGAGSLAKAHAMAGRVYGAARRGVTRIDQSLHEHGVIPRQETSSTPEQST